MTIFRGILQMQTSQTVGTGDPQYFTLYNVTEEDATRYSCITFDKEHSGHYIYHWLKVLPGEIGLSVMCF